MDPFARRWLLLPIMLVGVVGAGCPDRNREAALQRLQLVVDEQKAADAVCEARILAEPSPATVAWECLERRTMQLERYTGLLSMVSSPQPDEVVPAFPAISRGVAEAPSDDDGKRLFAMNQCLACHSIDGSPLVGQSMKGLYGSTVTHADGSTAVVDDAYMREALWHPDRRVTKGFTAVMPSYEGKLNAATVDVMIAYIKTLQ